MRWADRSTVKKGKLGEQIVRAYLEQIGYVCYEPTTKGPHCFDFLAVRNKKKFIIAEVKAKPSMDYYPATGINIEHYNEYKAASKKLRIDVVLFFVDDKLEKVYCQTLRRLDKKRLVRGREYPNTKITKGIILWPIECMIDVKELSRDEVNSLKQLSTSKSY